MQVSNGRSAASTAARHLGNARSLHRPAKGISTILTAHLADDSRTFSCAFAGKDLRTLAALPRRDSCVNSSNIVCCVPLLQIERRALRDYRRTSLRCRRIPRTTTQCFSLRKRVRHMLIPHLDGPVPSWKRAVRAMPHS